MTVSKPSSSRKRGSNSHLDSRWSLPSSDIEGGNAAWFVYLLRGSDGSLYTGITTDVNRRLREHNAGKGGAYSRTRRPWQLIFQEIHPTRSSVLKREAEIKSWDHLRKEKLKKSKVTQLQGEDPSHAKVAARGLLTAIKRRL